MPDIQMRFHRDMLVLSSPLEATLHHQGVDAAAPIDALCVDEPETVLEALRSQSAMGIACLVTPTNGITRARLAHERLADKSAEVATAAVKVLKRLNPQHILGQIGPTGLPLDVQSKTSMVANRDQYADAALAFPSQEIDGLLLNGFASTDDLLCACMGVRKSYDGVLFASIDADAAGSAAIEEAIELMDEYEVDVAGIETSLPADEAAQLIERACRVTDLPLLVQLKVLSPGGHAASNPYDDADSLMPAAMRLRGAGAQFLQASGHANANHAGALMAATMGLDAVR